MTQSAVGNALRGVPGVETDAAELPPERHGGRSLQWRGAVHSSYSSYPLSSRGKKAWWAFASLVPPYIESKARLPMEEETFPLCFPKVQEKLRCHRDWKPA